MNKELLERIEKLEETVKNIRNSCSCLRKEIEVIPPDLEDLCGGENFNCEPWEDELPEMEEPEIPEEPEHECEDGCPGCLSSCEIEEPEEPEEEKDHD